MIVFSRTSLRAFLQSHGVLPTSPSGPDTIGADVLAFGIDGHTLVVTRGDDRLSPLVLISEDAVAALRALGGQILDRALERVDRVAREFASPPVSLPPVWHKYQEDNRIAFFALPRPQNTQSLRWIAECLPNADVVFWTLTSREAELRLGDYDADYSSTSTARTVWETSSAAAVAALPPLDPGAQPLQASVDLQVVGAGAVSRHRTLSAWRPLLTPTQIEVLEYDAPEALKVRGSAGTGKTLTLQLKALSDVYAAADRDEDLRVLFLTHSWALTELVDASFHTIDERGLVAGHVDVMPLTWLREALMGPLPEGVEILGDDSLEGKKEQLSLISQTIDEIVTRDWLTYASAVSGHIRDAVEADRTSDERITLCWTLMREFSEVIDANRLKVGIDSLRRYLDIEREPWMTSLDEVADREFTYAVYRRFVQGLAEEGSLTTDQALDDFRRYLESYAWNIRRATEGYDLVLVDEFHLFNDTERYVVHLLTRDAESAPRLILAIDPRQSPFALLTGLEQGSLSRAAMENLGTSSNARSVELLTVHRFSREIYALVRLIHERFPNLIGIGEDWSVDLSNTTAPRAGSKPRIVLATSRGAAVTAALEIAQQAAATTSGDERVAVVAASAAELDSLKAELAQTSPRGSMRITLLESRDDVERLNYEQRSIVVGSAEYCAGLQFSQVVVLAGPGDASVSGGASARRASLSDLYLAVTRAEDRVTLVTWGSDGPIAAIATSALADGVAEILTL